MTFSIQGVAVSRGIAIGRAVVVASRIEVRHYFIDAAQVDSEIERVRRARDAVVEELQRLVEQLPADAPSELGPLLEVHLMLLQDEVMANGVRHWIAERLYNAEWALVTQLEQISRQFDEMEDPYLRERKGDLEQVIDRVLRHMRGVAVTEALPLGATQQPPLDDMHDAPLVLVAQDLSPADMLQFKRSVFAGFVTAVGGKTSHTAIVARSMDIPAIVGARAASQLIRQDDWVVIDGAVGIVLVDPSPILLEEYRFRQRQDLLERERLVRLRDKPAVTLNGERVELLANIEQPSDTLVALHAGAEGVGLFRSEFLFMGRDGRLPGEDEQFASYRAAVEGMQGMPVTIRTIDVGADKPLEKKSAKDTSLNPALGLRAIRWSLADPSMFRTQLRAILRAAALGPVQLLFPMVSHIHEARSIVAQVQIAQSELAARNMAYGQVQLGAMIEIPAAALIVRELLQYFDFVSIGTNDLIQYTLAIDRADETVAHLYDPLHPAVLRLLAQVIEIANAMGKDVCVCGEMAGDTGVTHLLLGLGLRKFSMHPAQILSVKQEILRADTRKLQPWARALMTSENVHAMLQTAVVQ